MTDKFHQGLSLSVAHKALFEIRRKLLTNLKSELNQRGVVSRSSSDDFLFKDFNTLIAISLGSGFGFEIYLTQLLRDIEERVLEYEKLNSTSVHKLIFRAKLRGVNLICVYFRRYGRDTFFDPRTGR